MEGKEKPQKAMETVYNSLKSTGQNNVEGVINMMKNAGMLAPGGEEEDYIRQVFNKTGNVKYEQFRVLMSQIAKGLGIPIAEFGGQLTAAPLLHTDSNYDLDSPSPSQHDSRTASYDDFNSPGQSEDSQDQEESDDGYEDDDGP